MGYCFAAFYFSIEASEVKRLVDEIDRFQNIKKLDGKLIVKLPESVILYFGLEENAELEFTIDKERIIIKERIHPFFRAT